MQAAKQVNYLVAMRTTATEININLRKSTGHCKVQERQFRDTGHSISET